MIERKIWIDYAKTFGILLIVFGHLRNSQLVGSFLWTFHVPLFFFLAGYLFNDKRNAKDFLKNQTTRILVPYIALFITLFVIDSMKYGNFSNEGFLQSMKALLYGANSYNGFVRAQLWFFPSFFTVNILYFFIIRNREYLMVLPLAVSIYLYSNGLINQFFSIDLSLLGLNFFMAGVAFKRFEVIEILKKQHSIILMILSIFLFFVVLDFAKVGNHWYGGDKYAMSFIGGILGSIMIVVFSLFLDKTIGSNLPVRFVSKNTLLIMAFHLEFYVYGYRWIGESLKEFPILQNAIITLLVVVLLTPIIILINILIPEYGGTKRTKIIWPFKSIIQSDK